MHGTSNDDQLLKKYDGGRMKQEKQKKLPSLRAGFSLIELVVVLGVIGAIIAGIWTYETSVQQNANIEQSAEAISLLADATRNIYANNVVYNAVGVATGAGISGGIAQVVSTLVGAGAMPSHLLRTSTSTCGTGAPIPSTFADSPFGENTVITGCGSLGVCAWLFNFGTPGNSQPKCNTTDGAPTTAQQYFAIEFSSLDLQSCIALVERVTPTSPAAGLRDIAINGTNGGTTGIVLNGLGSLPVSPANALKYCTGTAAPYTVDFIYYLHAPSS
jgi:prepilin-type N-terminal cleavage/methylation domain-containing protein